MYNYEYQDYLMHYGIKGMKWGVRRFQNKDGTPANAEKKKDEKPSYAKSIKRTIKRDLGILAVTAIVGGVTAVRTGSEGAVEAIGEMGNWTLKASRLYGLGELGGVYLEKHGIPRGGD